MHHPKGQIKRLKHQPAFSLTELLISIAVYSVIATFTIGKLLNVMVVDSQIRLYKSTVITIQQVLWQSRINGALSGSSSGSDVINYFLKNMNSVKVCNSNSITQGCSGASIQTYDSQSGLITPDNVGVVFGTRSGALDIWAGGPYFRVRIDLNNTAGPNVWGEDVFYLSCFTENTEPQNRRFSFRCFPNDSALLDGTMWTKAFVGKNASPLPASDYYN